MPRLNNSPMPFKRSALRPGLLCLVLCLFAVQCALPGRAMATEPVTAYIEAKWIPATSLAEKIRPLLSERGAAIPDDAAGLVIVVDDAATVKRIVEIAAVLDRAPGQVMVEAKLIQTSEAALQAFGISLGGSVNLGPASVQFGSGCFALATGRGLQSLEAELGLSHSSASSESHATLSVLTLEGEPANLHMGADVPLPSGRGTEYRRVGLDLVVTPTRLPGDRFMLDLFIASDQPRGQSIQTHETSAKITVADKETVLIGSSESSTETSSSGSVLGLVFGGTGSASGSEKGRLVVLVRARAK